MNRLELAMPGLARLELSLVLDGVSAAIANAPDSAKDDVSLRTATLVYDDASLFAKLVAGAAGKQPEAALLEEPKAFIAALAKDQGQATMAVFDALASYLADYRQPKGALRVTVNPASNLKTKDFDKLTVANAIVDVFGLSVSYAGTRTGTALAYAAPAAKAPPPDAPRAKQAAPPGQQSAGQTPAQPAELGPVTCTPGERLFALSDGAWWSATVRESTSSSQRCVVRLEGSDSDEDVLVGRAEMLAWSLDGPGLPAGACRKGDRVWTKSEGAWYPATVRATSKSGSPCTFRFENDADAEDETAELKRLRVIQ